MTTIKREDKATGAITVYTDLNAAVDQFITDNYNAQVAYLTAEEDTETLEELGSLEDWLTDMPTVFETQSMLDGLEEDTEATAGSFIYTK